MLSQIWIGPGEGNLAHKQFHFSYQGTLGAGRWIQDAQMGWPSGFPVSNHRVQRTKLLR